MAVFAFEIQNTELCTTSAGHFLSSLKISVI